MLKLKSMEIKAEHDLLTYLTLCGFWKEKKKVFLAPISCTVGVLIPIITLVPYKKLNSFSRS